MALHIDYEITVEHEAGWYSILERRALNKFRIDIAEDMDPKKRGELVRGYLDRVIYKGRHHLRRALTWADRWIMEWMQTRKNGQ